MNQATPRAQLVYAGQLLALAVAYVVAGRLGLVMSHVDGFASLVWSPSALSLVALVIGGARLWPASLAAVHVFLATLSLTALALGALVCELEQSRWELCAAVSEARAATSAKDEFLAVLSHELRTPLQAMLGWTQVLRAHACDARALEKGLATIERNVRTQAQLIEDLLDVSRIVAGKLRLDRRRVALGDVLAAALEGVRSAAELVAVVLHDAGAEVHAVSSARAAVGELGSFRPDLLLSDIGMPGEDGYALIRQVRAAESARGGHLPAVALTAFASGADREEALSLGFDAHLAKPADAGELARLSATLVGRIGREGARGAPQHC